MRISVAEPATLVTDYLIAVACAFFAFSLAAANAPLEWPAGFTLGSASALLGGTVHGFPNFAGKRVRDTLWSLTLLLFGASAAAFGAGAVSLAVPDLTDLTVRLTAVTVLGVYAIAVLHKPEFSTAGYMALIMLATFVAMAVSLAMRVELRAAALTLVSVFLNVAGVAVQMKRVAPHPRFNHNDLFHLFQLAALWCLYAAIRELP